MNNYLVGPLFAAVVGLVAIQAHADTRVVDCDKGQSLQKELVNAQSSSAPIRILFTGTCFEPLRLTRDRTTIDGNGSGVIAGTVRVFGARVTLENLSIRRPGPGLIVSGARVRLLGVDISDNDGAGLQVIDNAIVFLSGGTVNANASSGIVVQASTLQVAESAIEWNGGDGILADNHSAVIVSGSDIAHNVEIGLSINFHSTLDLQEQTRVLGNQQIGIFAGEDGGIRVSSPEVEIFDWIYCGDNESSFVDRAGAAIYAPVVCSDFNE